MDVDDVGPALRTGRFCGRHDLKEGLDLIGPSQAGTMEWNCIALCCVK